MPKTKKSKSTRPFYDVYKLRASFLTFQIIEMEMENKEIHKKMDISFKDIYKIKKAKPIKLEALFKVARSMKKPVTDFLLK